MFLNSIHVALCLRQTLYYFNEYLLAQFGLIKLISSHKPIIASTKISSRTTMLLKNIAVPSAPFQVYQKRLLSINLFLIFNDPPFYSHDTSYFFCQYAAAMKSQSIALESILRRLFCGSNEFAGGSPEVHFQLQVIFEGVLK